MWTMKISKLALLLFFLSGCSTQETACYSQLQCGQSHNVNTEVQWLVSQRDAEGRLIKGKAVYPGVKSSSFEGEFIWLDNPYYRVKPFKVPSYGTYTSILGERFTGRLQYVHRPSIDIVGNAAKEEARRDGIEGAYGSLFLLGEKVDTKGEKTLGVWHADYRGDKFHSGLLPSSMKYLDYSLKQSEINNLAEKKTEAIRRKSMAQSQFSLDDFLEGATEILLFVSDMNYQYQLNAKQSQSNYSQALPQKINTSPKSLAQQTAANKPYSESKPQIVTQPSSKQTSKNYSAEQSASKAQVAKQQPKHISIKKPHQVIGVTPMYYHYDLALDLAQVNASNRAAKICRNKGGKTAKSKQERKGKMLEKTCDKLNSDDTQYKCKVKMNFNCYFKTTNQTN